MTNIEVDTLGQALFRHANLSAAQQDLVLGTLSDYRPWLAHNPNPLTPAAWRACYETKCTTATARGLLTNPAVTAEDIDWVLRVRKERRQTPLVTLLHRWEIDESQQALLMPRRGNSAMTLLLAHAPGMGSLSRLTAASDNGFGELHFLLDGAKAPSFTPDQLATAYLAAADKFANADVPEAWVRDTADIAHREPELRTVFATSGSITLTAAAAQTELDVPSQQAALSTLTAALTGAEPYTSGHREAAILGLLALLDRCDTDPGVRDAALEVVNGDEQARAERPRRNVAGTVNPFPVGVRIDQLDSEQVDLVLLKGNSGLPARSLMFLDLATAPLLTRDQLHSLSARSVYGSHDRGQAHRVIIDSRLAGEPWSRPQKTERATGPVHDGAKFIGRHVHPELIKDTGVDPSAWVLEENKILITDGNSAGNYLMFDRRFHKVIPWILNQLDGDANSLAALVRLADQFQGTIGDLVSVSRAVMSPVAKTA